jgi:hypothetical protein
MLRTRALRLPANSKAGRASTLAHNWKAAKILEFENHDSPRTTCDEGLAVTIPFQSEVGRAILANFSS